MSTFQAVKRTSKSLIPEGLHAGTITAIRLVPSKTGTPQIEATFEASNGTVRKYWLNRVGYKKNSDGDFLNKGGRVINVSEMTPEERIIAWKKRVESEESTAICTEMIGHFFHDLGLTPDDDIAEDLGNLKGLTCLIGVVGNGSKGRISKTFANDQLEKAEELMSKEIGEEIELSELELAD